MIQPISSHPNWNAAFPSPARTESTTAPKLTVKFRIHAPTADLRTESVGCCGCRGDDCCGHACCIDEETPLTPSHDGGRVGLAFGPGLLILRMVLPSSRRRRMEPRSD